LKPIAEGCNRDTLLCGVESCARELGVLHEATVRKDFAKVNEKLEDWGGFHAIRVIVSLENISMACIQGFTLVRWTCLQKKKKKTSSRCLHFVAGIK
jgi:hypothetical protein